MSEQKLKIKMMMISLYKVLILIRLNFTLSDFAFICLIQEAQIDK